MKKSLSVILALTLMWPAGLSAESMGAPIKKHDVYQASSSPVPMTLADCYRLSLKQSEIIAAEYQKIIETEGRFLQALSIMMPYASFVSTDSQEEPQKGGAPASTTGVLTSSSVNPSKDSVRYFHLKQTLFSGFKAFSAMKGAKYEKTQRINERIRAEQLLLVDVSNAFYLLQEKRQDIIALKGIKRALLDRIKELRDREKLGRSRPSEVVNSKTSLYAVEAELQVARSQETVTRQVLEFLTGVPVGDLLCTEDNCLPEEVKSETYYLTKSLTRADIIAACNEWQVAVKARQIIDSDFLPEVTFESNYYTQRTTVSKGVDWDVMLKVNVPIFEGTETLGRSKEARAQAKVKELMYQRSKRAAPQDVRDTYVKLVTAVSVQKELRKAYTTAKLNYHLQRRDYTLSLVSNLDVLDAIKTLHNAEREYIRSLYEAKRLYWQLQVACGETLMENINDTF
jgi:outer membrane protein